MSFLCRFFRCGLNGREECFCVEANGEISCERLSILRGFFQELPTQKIQRWSNLSGSAITVGPRLAFATAYSLNAVAVLQACGFPEVNRVEVLRREQVMDVNQLPIFDRMTEMQYLELPRTFVSDAIPEPVRIIPVLGRGVDVLQLVNKEFGLSWDSADVDYFYRLLTEVLRRNPTDVECFGLGIAVADHTRHRTWNARLVIDGQVRPYTLFDLAKAPHLALGDKYNNTIAFHDNASAIRGFKVRLLLRRDPTRQSFVVVEYVDVNLTMTVETHIYPTSISPFPGAETGIGGCYRDTLAVGRGGLHLFSSAGFCTDNLWIRCFVQPWERLTKQMQPKKLATPLQIALEAPAGTWDYGNKYGVPVICGFFYTVGMELPVGNKNERYGYVKPLMLAGNAGYMFDAHTHKQERKLGQLLVRIGGPAYCIGLGGGAGSSVMTGTNAADFDFNAVQRGNAEMGQLTRRVIEACVEMGEGNPISFIHDQGAGGVFNVFSELCEATGGRIEIRNVKLGDTTLSVLAILCSEFQESYGLLVKKENLEVFQQICAREGCPCEILGTLTDDKRFVVFDENDGTAPVDLPLDQVLTGLPQKMIEDISLPKIGKPSQLPEGLLVREALERVLRLPSVACKEFLTRRVDRSVGGLVVRQQGCGPLHLPICDCAVSALSFMDSAGLAEGIGVQPLKTMLNPATGVRMTIAEGFTNIVSAGISKRTDVSFSGNWMWAAKLGLPSEVAKLELAAVAAKDFFIALGTKEDGGKDSSSFAAMLEGGQVIKSPETFVATAYAPVPDVGKSITPDLKQAGDSLILLMKLGTAEAKNRLGGSALLQCYGQIGDVSPDVDDPLLFKRSIEAVTEMIKKGLLLSGHDCSDGGLIVTLLEMCFPSNIGMDVSIDGAGLALDCLFAEEPQLVMECRAHDLSEIREIAGKNQVEIEEIGQTMYSLAQEARIRVSCSDREVLNESVHDLRVIWQEFAYRMERLAINPICADAEWEANLSQDDMVAPRFHLTFVPKLNPVSELVKKPVIAVIREEGSNGDKELVAAFREVGFAVMDVAMSDLLRGRIADLKNFRGVAFPGGFSYSDVFGAGVAWAKKIQLHPHLKKIFTDFYERRDTFSFGPCNGCQLMTRLGWAPFGLGPGYDPDKQPFFVHNLSGAFESRPVTVEILESPAIMLKGMVGCRLPVWVAHGEGRLWFPDPEMVAVIARRKLAPLAYVHPNGVATDRYPFNPNGSSFGWAGLCDDTGRHLAMMPHPERMWQVRQWPWVPQNWRNMEASPWLRMFQNAYDWCCGK